MRQADIQTGAEVYYAPDPDWKHHRPTKAVIVSTDRVRIVRRRSGPFYLVSHTPDPAGNALVVDLHELARVRRTAVPLRHLRGLWQQTLAKLGRTVADVKAYDAAITDLATRPQISGGDLLGLAARDQNLNDDAFTALAQAVDNRLSKGQ